MRSCHFRSLIWLWFPWLSGDRDPRFLYGCPPCGLVGVVVAFIFSNLYRLSCNLGFHLRAVINIQSSFIRSGSVASQRSEFRSVPLRSCVSIFSNELPTFNKHTDLSRSSSLHRRFVFHRLRCESVAKLVLSTYRNQLLSTRAKEPPSRLIFNYRFLCHVDLTLIL